METTSNVLASWWLSLVLRFCFATGDWVCVREKEVLSDYVCNLANHRHIKRTVIMNPSLKSYKVISGRMVVARQLGEASFPAHVFHTNDTNLLSGG